MITAGGIATWAGTTWYGFLEQIHGHPTVRLVGALALAALLVLPFLVLAL